MRVDERGCWGFRSSPWAASQADGNFTYARALAVFLVPSEALRYSLILGERSSLPSKSLKMLILDFRRSKVLAIMLLPHYLPHYLRKNFVIR